MTSIEPNIARLYTLIWRPGASMHPLWWKMLELDACQPVYCTIPHCRRWIDQAIVARRKFPAAVAPCALTQPEYWVLKSYLKVVQPYLDAVSCAQLNMFSTARAPEGFYARDTRATLVE